MITRRIAAGSLTAALAVGAGAMPAAAHNGGHGGWEGSTNEGGTALMLTRGVKQAMRAEGITVEPVAPAKQWNPVLFSFPAVRTDETTITHSGGVSVSKGSSSLVLSDFVVDTSDGTVDATVAGVPTADVFTLDGLRSGGKWSKADVRLGNGQADTLDAALGTTVFEDGMYLGRVATWFGWQKSWHHGDRGWGSSHSGWKTWSGHGWQDRGRDWSGRGGNH